MTVEDAIAWFENRIKCITLPGAKRSHSKGQERTAQWISVKDRLPDTCGLPCLLCGENAFGQIRVFAGFTGYMERGKFEWHSNQKDIDIDVWTITHWMPLPESPKEGMR